MTIDHFRSLFRYDQDKVGYIGVERECFTCDQTGKIVSQAHKVLMSVKKGPEFGYELSACQVETRIGPCLLKDLHFHLDERNAQLNDAFADNGLSALHSEVAPADMPLDIYPDPTGRYQKMTKNMPREILLAACRVVATHVHIGMRDHDMALRVYNHVTRHFVELCEMGDGSCGERFAIYKQRAPDYEPKPYANWEDYYQRALAKGFVEDPRKCWTLIRISVHGTIEFRMFGATDSIGRIVGWATRCHELCQEAMTKA